MNIYTIGDLHLAISTPEKNMGIFGCKWEGYMGKIKTNWEKTCTDEDIIIIPGDISWGMNISEIHEDFKYINDMPGKKLMLKGNHDYWWDTVAKLEKYVAENEFDKIFFIHNNSYNTEETVICGTRGWILPEDKKFTEQDIKVYSREIGRLKRSLENISSKNTGNTIVAFHYPPFSVNCESFENDIIKILKEFNVKKCVFGHIHDANQFDKWEKTTAKMTKYTGIEFNLVSSDFLDFSLKKLY